MWCAWKWMGSAGSRTRSSPNRRRRNERSGHRLKSDRAATSSAQDRTHGVALANKENDMSANRKIIITCAVTGSIHTPSMSPALPVTAQEIADAAVGAAEAGAAIVHLHARNPAGGRPRPAPGALEPFLRPVKPRSNRGGDLPTGRPPDL